MPTVKQSARRSGLDISRVGAVYWSFVVLIICFLTGLSAMGWTAAMAIGEKTPDSYIWFRIFLSGYGLLIFYVSCGVVRLLSGRSLSGAAWLRFAPFLGLTPVAIDLAGPYSVNFLPASVLSAFYSLRNVLEVPGVLALVSLGRGGVLVHSHFELKGELMQYLLFVPLNTLGWGSAFVCAELIFGFLRRRTKRIQR